MRFCSRTSPCLAMTVWVTAGLAVQYTMKAMLAAITMRAHHACGSIEFSPERPWFLLNFGLYLPWKGFFLAFSSLADASDPPLGSDLRCLTVITSIFKSC